MASRHTRSIGGERREAYNLLENRFASCYSRHANHKCPTSAAIGNQSRITGEMEYFVTLYKKSMLSDQFLNMSQCVPLAFLLVAMGPTNDADSAFSHVHLLA